MAEVRPIREELEYLYQAHPGWQKLIPIADIAEMSLRAAPERRWALTDWLPMCQATYLTGPGSAGKSLLSLQLAVCKALGLPFMGIETEQANVLYLSCEDDLNELHRRLQTVCNALGVRMGDLDGRLLLLSLVGQIGTELATFQEPERDQYGNPGPLIRPTQRYKALEGMAIAHDVGFIVLDNVAHLFAGNENVRNEVAAFVALLNSLAIRVSGAVLLIGHPNKAGDSFSGSTAWENQVRSRLFMETPKEADGSVLDRDARVLRREKSNYACNGAELRFRWHEWAFVRDVDLPRNIRAEVEETARATADNAYFFACLAVRNKQERPVSESPASRTYAPRVFAEMSESKGIGVARLEAAMERLFRIDEIERGFVGRIDRKDKFGLRIKRAEVRADPAPTGCAEVRPQQSAECAVTHPIPKGIRGAALGSAAPHDEQDIILDADGEAA